MSDETADRKCPLCAHNPVSAHYRDRYRPYLRCPRCDLVFVPPEFHLDPLEEKRRYDFHENDPSDPRYRKFLSRLADPLIERLQKGAHGLDFGCGPGPALAQMLGEQGFTVDVFDPFYAPDESVWIRSYDFIASTEVFEHLRRPAAELDRLFSILKPGGVLAIMTKLRSKETDFGQWSYIRDDTHIMFYSAVAFRYVAARWGAEAMLIEGDVVILRKPTAAVAP